MKTYYFKDDSWYDNPACDCCEGDWVEVYNIDTTRHPDFNQDGSAHSLEERWESVLIHEGILEERDECLDYGVPRELLLNNDIRVVVVD